MGESWDGWTRVEDAMPGIDKLVMIRRGGNRILAKLKYNEDHGVYLFYVMHDRSIGMNVEGWQEIKP